MLAKCATATTGGVALSTDMPAVGRRLASCSTPQCYALTASDNANWKCQTRFASPTVRIISAVPCWYIINAGHRAQVARLASASKNVSASKWLPLPSWRFLRSENWRVSLLPSHLRTSTR